MGLQRDRAQRRQRRSKAAAAFSFDFDGECVLLPSLEKRQLLRSSSAAASTKAPLASTSIWEFCSATKMKEESQTSLEPQRRSLDKMKDCWHNFAATVEHCHFGIKGGTKVSIWSALVCREIKGNLKPSFKKISLSLLIIKRAEWITRYFTLPWIWIIFFLIRNFQDFRFGNASSEFFRFLNTYG